MCYMLRVQSDIRKGRTYRHIFVSLNLLQNSVKHSRPLFKISAKWILFLKRVPSVCWANNLIVLRGLKGFNPQSTSLPMLTGQSVRAVNRAILLTFNLLYEFIYHDFQRWSYVFKHIYSVDIDVQYLQSWYAFDAINWFFLKIIWNGSLWQIHSYQDTQFLKRHPRHLSALGCLCSPPQ